MKITKDYLMGAFDADGSITINRRNYDSGRKSYFLTFSYCKSHNHEIVDEFEKIFGGETSYKGNVKYWRGRNSNIIPVIVEYFSGNLLLKSEQMKIAEEFILSDTENEREILWARMTLAQSNDRMKDHPTRIEAKKILEMVENDKSK